MPQPADERDYAVDEVYRDSTDQSQNQFYTWLRVRNSGGMRPSVRADGSLAFLVLVSAHVNVATYNPWEDVYEPAQGRLWYWGDAKAHREKGRDDWVGNQYLKRIWTLVNEGKWSEVPPILHFRKPSSGAVQFTGVCVLKDLRDAWMEDDGRRVQNYRALIEVLPIAKVRVAWLRSRQDGQDLQAPPEWLHYARSGDHGRLLVYAKHIRTTKEQLPARGTFEESILDELRQIAPPRFERLVVRAFQALEVSHNITQTRQTRDGGFDFFGSFRLPPPLSYTIPLKGEVKRYKADAGVGPADVARLVARLQRGEHGVFATTSYFTQQAQDEIQADRYPIELVSGGRLAGLLSEIGATSKGRLRPAWLED